MEVSSNLPNPNNELLLLCLSFLENGIESIVAGVDVPSPVANVTTLDSKTIPQSPGSVKFANPVHSLRIGIGWCNALSLVHLVVLSDDQVASSYFVSSQTHSERRTDGGMLMHRRRPLGMVLVRVHGTRLWPSGTTALQGWLRTWEGRLGHPDWGSLRRRGLYHQTISKVFHERTTETPSKYLTV